jgi:hypothetical protein
MHKKNIVRPHQYPQFQDRNGSKFYLITNPERLDDFIIERDGSYVSCEILSYSGENFVEVLQLAEEPAHVLVISPNHLITSVETYQIGHRQLAIMAANSTPNSSVVIDHFLKVLEKTKPLEQRKIANNFFDHLEQEQSLQIVNDFYGTTASFGHLDNDYEWFEQGGPLEWGQQQMVPSGELSVLPAFHGQFDSTRNLAINGELVFEGYPILHSGKPSFLREDQQRIYEILSILKDHALIATVKDGWITKLHATHPSAKQAKSMLEALFDVDSRYRLIWEMGFGINTQLNLWPDNTAMNEVYGGDNGAIHWGLGLTPFTQYHLDIICPNTKVLGETGQIFVGLNDRDSLKGDKEGIVRHIANTCPCISY